MQNALHKNPNDSYLERNGHTSIGKKKKKRIVSLIEPLKIAFTTVITKINKDMNRKITNKYILKESNLTTSIPAKKIL